MAGTANRYGKIDLESVPEQLSGIYSSDEQFHESEKNSSSKSERGIKGRRVKLSIKPTGNHPFQDIPAIGKGQ